MISASGKVWIVKKFARGHPERGRFVRLWWVRTGDFCDFSTHNPPSRRNGASYDQGYYWTLLGNGISAFDWYQNQRPRMTLNWPWTVITHFFTLHMCLSEPATKIKMMIDPYCQRQNVAQGSLFLLKYGLCGYFQGVAGDGSSNESGVGFSAIFDQYVAISRSKTVHSRHKVRNHMQAIEWCHFRWPWVTLEPDFKRRAGLSATAGLSCLISYEWQHFCWELTAYSDDG